MRRFAFVNNHREGFGPLDSGAIATCIWEVCRAASADGTVPSVLTRRQESAPYEWTDIHWLDVQVRPNYVWDRIDRRFTGWVSRLQRSYAHSAAASLAELRPEVVFCNNDPQVAVYLARRLPRTTVVHWFHNVESVSDRWRRAIHASRVRLVGVSRYTARAVEHAYHFAPGEIDVALNGVDCTRFEPAGLNHSGPLTVGFLGRVAVEKGVDVFLKAALELAVRQSNFRIELIGDTNWGHSEPGQYRDQVDSLVHVLQAARIEVVRRGHVARNDLPHVLAALDIQVVPSRWDEPFGLVVAEGMACALPIVASAVGGIPEVLGEAGLLVPREDPAALARAMKILLNDTTMRHTLASSARQRAESFTWLSTWQALCRVSV